MVTLAEISVHNPALAYFNNRLFLAWTDGNGQLGLVSSADGGITFDNSPHMLAERSIAGPALTVYLNPGDFKERLYLAWTGTDDDHHVNVISSLDGFTFEDKQTLPEHSIAGPALATASFDSFEVLYLAWTGTDDDHHVNIISSPDGFTFEDKQTLPEHSIAGPALAGHTPGELVLAWTGTDDAHLLNLSLSSTGFFDSGHKRTLKDPWRRFESFTGPALAWAFEERFSGALLAYAHRHEHRVFILSTDGFDPQPVGSSDRLYDIENFSVGGPAITSILRADFEGDVIFVAWADMNNHGHLNVEQFQL